METAEMSPQPTPPKKNLEGTIVQARGLRDYEHKLGFSAELLRGETVLNFGAGHTHLEKQLLDRGISSTIINLDIINEPTSIHDPFRLIVSIPVSIYRKFQENRGQDVTSLRQLERKIAGIEGRKFVKYDGRNIPFPDGSFDHLLALWSTYQIPQEYKAEVYRELFRVGKFIHIGPMYQNDLDILRPLAQEMGFEIVACQPMEVLPIKRMMGKALNIKHMNDYDRYLAQTPYEQRVLTPVAKDVTMAKPHGVVLGLGGNTIILRKIQTNGAIEPMKST